MELTVQNATPVDKERVHFFNAALLLRGGLSKQSEDLIKQLEQICELDKMWNHSVFLHVHENYFDDFLALIDKLPVKINKEDSFRTYEKNGKRYFGYICPSDIARSFGVSALRKTYTDTDTCGYSGRRSGALSDEIKYVICGMGENVVDTLIETLYTKFTALYSHSSQFEDDLYFSMQEIKSHHYRNKLLTSLLSSLTDTRKADKDYYHRKWYRNYCNRSEKAEIPCVLAGAVALCISDDEARNLCSLGNDDNTPKLKFGGDIIENGSFRLCCLSRIIAAENNRYNSAEGQILVSLVHRFETICNEDPKSLLYALPWLISLGSDVVDNLIIYQTINNPKLQSELKALSGDDIPILATRADDILLRSNGISNNRAYDVITWWNDNLRGKSPDALNAPISTWIGNAHLEHLIRDIGRKAANKIDVDSGDEVMVTGELLRALKDEAAFLNGASGHCALSLDYQSFKSTGERECGADLVIRVRINHGNIKTTRLHFVVLKIS